MRKDIFLKKKFFIASSFLLLTLTPIIIYNIMMFWTRGHFDSALSSMIGMRPDDFSVVRFRSIDANVVKNFGNLLIALKKNFSALLLSAFILGYAVAVIQWVRRGTTPLTATVIIHSIFLATIFLFGELNGRYLSIGVPIFAIVFSLLFEYSRVLFRDHFKLVLSSYLLLGTILSFELLYAANTHVLKQPLVTPAFAYSHGVSDEGFEILDRFLRASVYGKLPEPRRVEAAGDIFQHNVRGEVILFDERANWFHRVWYVDRYVHYYQKPLIYFTDLFKMMEGEQDPNIFHFLEQKQVKSIWVVISERNIAGRSEFYKNVLDALVANFHRFGITPVAKIKNNLGEPSFTIYHVIDPE